MKSIVTALIATAVLGAPVFSQEPPQPSRGPQAAQQARPPQPPQSPQAPPAARERQPAEERERSPSPPPPPPPPAPPPPGERRPLPTQNVKVDVTITEQSGTSAPVKKVVSLVVADGRSSGVRSMTSAPIGNGNIKDLALNVDASVSVTPERRILLELRFIYHTVNVMQPLAGEGLSGPVTADEKATMTPRPAYGHINDSLTFLLTSGMPVVAARSADAATDRTVTVEVKAEILK